MLGNSTDRPNPTVKPCVDTGAAANVGFLSWWDAILFTHPEIIDNIYCVNKGKYKSIKMTGIVSEDTRGVTSTDLPIAVQLKTPYRNRDGRRIGITVALGISVSINFIISNAWMKKHRACIDYATDRMMMNFEDHNGFKLTYHRPVRETIDPNVRKSRQYFRDMMPVMATLASVMKVCNPQSNWLTHVDAVIQHFQVSTLSTTMIPEPLPLVGVLRTPNPTVNGRFSPATTPAVRHAIDVFSPRR